MMHWKHSFCRCWQQQLFGGVVVDVDVVAVVVVDVERGAPGHAPGQRVLEGVGPLDDVAARRSSAHFKK